MDLVFNAANMSSDSAQHLVPNNLQAEISESLLSLLISTHARSSETARIILQD